MGKRVVTRATIDEHLASGVLQIAVGEGDIVTALAREYAQERGVRLVPSGASVREDAGAAGSTAASPGAEDVDAIRKALVAALGYEPADLGGIIERALK